MRYKLWGWFRKYIGYPDNCMVPKKWIWVAYLLFPIKACSQKCLANPRYDVMRHAIIFNGYAYPVFLFTYLQNVDSFITVKEKGIVQQISISFHITKEV